MPFDRGVVLCAGGVPVNRAQLAALNAAGRALKALDLGAVRLRYRPQQPYLAEGYSIWLAPGDGPDIVGTGDTPEAALNDALGQRAREAA